jgi:hypothetical protein
MNKAVGIGACVMDTLINVPNYPKEDTKMRAESSKQAGGGPVATGLVAAARLGAEAEYIGVLSDDAGGSFVFVATQVRPIFPVLAGISGSYNTMFMLWSLLSYKKNVLRLVIRVNKKECAKAHSRAERGRLRQPTSSRECASLAR